MIQSGKRERVRELRIPDRVEGGSGEALCVILGESATPLARRSSRALLYRRRKLISRGKFSPRTGPYHTFSQRELGKLHRSLHRALHCNCSNAIKARRRQFNELPHLLASTNTFTHNDCSGIMSLASVRPAEINSSLDHISPRSMSNASLESQGGYQPPLEEPRSQGCSYEAVLTIEDLHTQINSCFSCGVNWSQQHVSLDCDECGGYALMRPCPLCEASACGEKWKRDFTMSHASSKARWQGVCKLSDRPTTIQHFPAPVSGCQALPAGCIAAARLARDLCQRLEKLSTQQRPS